MLPTDFFEDTEDTWGNYAQSLDCDLLRVIRAATHPSVPDAEAGAALAHLAHDQLTAFGTEGDNTLSDAELREVLAALRAVCSRLGVTFTVPFQDFGGFRAYWKGKGASGSGGWQARRNLLAELFDPMHNRLEALERQSLSAALLAPITAHPGTGWRAVDHEISELRRQFLIAVTPQDYNAVGLVCVRLTEALSATVYDPTRHLRAGETEPSVANTKQRLERYIEDSASGPDNATLRKLARDGIEYAQHVKHRGTPNSREVGIAADATLLLANILRRLDE